MTFPPGKGHSKSEVKVKDKALENNDSTMYKFRVRKVLK